MNPPSSPCRQQCRLDASGRYCTGCGRTLDEISAWARMSPAQQQAVWRRLEQSTKACERCGARFECGSAQGACWCASLPPLLSPAGGGDCLCPVCLRQATAP